MKRNLTYWGYRMQEHKGRFLGAFLSQGDMEILGSGYDAVGDTMNGGRIFLHGSAGAAAGYAMWGGALYIQGDAGDRAGIHIKATATLLIGGKAGSFLGEYQAGGTIILLGLTSEEPLLGDAPFAGMHGGKVFLRGDPKKWQLPDHVAAHPASETEMENILPHLLTCCAKFNWSLEELLAPPFTVVTPLTHRPYRSLYTPAY